MMSHAASYRTNIPQIRHAHHTFKSLPPRVTPLSQVHTSGDDPVSSTGEQPEGASELVLDPSTRADLHKDHDEQKSAAVVQSENEDPCSEPRPPEEERTVSCTQQPRVEENPATDQNGGELPDQVVSSSSPSAEQDSLDSSQTSERKLAPGHVTVAEAPPAASSPAAIIRRNSRASMLVELRRLPSIHDKRARLVRKIHSTQESDSDSESSDKEEKTKPAPPPIPRRTTPPLQPVTTELLESQVSSSSVEQKQSSPRHNPRPSPRRQQKRLLQDSLPPHSEEFEIETATPDLPPKPQEGTSNLVNEVITPELPSKPATATPDVSSRPDSQENSDHPSSSVHVLITQATADREGLPQESEEDEDMPAPPPMSTHPGIIAARQAQLLANLEQEDKGGDDMSSSESKPGADVVNTDTPHSTIEPAVTTPSEDMAIPTSPPDTTPIMTTPTPLKDTPTSSTDMPAPITTPPTPLTTTATVSEPPITTPTLSTATPTATSTSALAAPTAATTNVPAKPLPKPRRLAHAKSVDVLGKFSTLPHPSRSTATPMSTAPVASTGTTVPHTSRSTSTLPRNSTVAPRGQRKISLPPPPSSPPPPVTTSSPLDESSPEPSPLPPPHSDEHTTSADKHTTVNNASSAGTSGTPFETSTSESTNAIQAPYDPTSSAGDGSPVLTVTTASSALQPPPAPQYVVGGHGTMRSLSHPTLAQHSLFLSSTKVAANAASGNSNGDAPGDGDGAGNGKLTVSNPTQVETVVKCGPMNTRRGGPLKKKRSFLRKKN